MNIGVPLAAILAVIIIVYAFTKLLGVSVRFSLLFACGFMGLFLGLLLPRMLLPKLSLTGTFLVVGFFMLTLSVFFAWFFSKEENAVQETDVLLAYNNKNEEPPLAFEQQQEDAVHDDNNDVLELIEEKQQEESVDAATEPMAVAPAIDDVLPIAETVEEQDSESWCNDEFDPASVFGADLNTMRYDIAEKEKTSEQAVVKTPAVRKSSYKEDFFEEDYKNYADADFSVNNETVSASEAERNNTAPINDNGSEAIHDNSPVREMPEQNLPEADFDAIASCDSKAEQVFSKDNGITSDEKIPAALEKNNLVNFTPSEPETDRHKQKFDNESNYSKVIDFSARLARRVEKYAQNSETILKNKAHKVQERYDFDLQTTEPDAQKTYTQTESMELAANGHYTGEYTKQSEEEFFHGETACEPQLHCSEDDLPYTRVLADDDKAVTPKDLEETLNKSLLPKKVPKSDSFEDLLDFAFAQKERAVYDDALFVFQMALEMYADNDSALLVIAEIANIYRQQGEYDKAITILREGLKITKNPAEQKDFMINIGYLKIIKNILVVNGLQLLPYDEIPDKVKESIETEFAAWKMSS